MGKEDTSIGSQQHIWIMIQVGYTYQLAPIEEIKKKVNESNFSNKIKSPYASQILQKFFCLTFAKAEMYNLVLT